MIKIIKGSPWAMAVICALMLIQLVGCGEDEEDKADADMEGIDASEAPPLPPYESMMVDLSLFDEKVAGAPGTSKLVTYRNFLNAVVRVGTIKAVLVAAAAVPAAVFAAAAVQPPIAQGTDTWVWSYSATVGYTTFTAELTGVKKGGVIDWSMVVSTDAPPQPVEDFLWYTGTSEWENTSGSWQFYDISTPDEQNPIVNINWSASPGQEEVEKAKLTIENVDSRAGNENLGDVLDYDVGQDRVSLSYSDVSESEVWDITWDRETGAGSLRVPGYNDGQEACWNASKQDITCD